MSGLMLVLFVLQIVLAILLTIIILMQSSDEDALSGIGVGASSSSILSHKGSVDLITKITIFLGFCLIANSLALTIISKNRFKKGNTVVEDYLKKIEQKQETNEKDKILEEKVEKIIKDNEQK